MPELHPADPRRLGSYEIVARLGEGGQGVVFLATDPAGTQVAVKLLRPDLTEDESARNRFLREVQAAKAVKRFCTAQVLAADVAGDRPYIVSEYIPGPSLYRLVQDEGPRAGAALERLAIGTVTALVAIHKAGIVHRDFKPHNVLVGPDGPRVIDFGIARALDASATASTQAVGTPAYMSPEQIKGEKLSNAVDMFSWAAVMVFAATGKPAFGQDTITAVIYRILNEEPELDGLPDDLRPIVADCLTKTAGQRPTAAAVLMRLLGQDLVEIGAESRHETAAAPATMLQPADVGSEILGLGAEAAGADTDPSRNVVPWGAPDAGTDTSFLPPVPGHGGGGGGGGGGGTSRRAVALYAVLGAVVLAVAIGLGAMLLSQAQGSGAQTSTDSTASPSDSAGGALPSAGPDTGPTGQGGAPQNGGLPSHQHHSAGPTGKPSGGPSTSASPTASTPTAPGSTPPVQDSSPATDPTTGGSGPPTPPADQTPGTGT